MFRQALMILFAVAVVLAASFAFSSHVTPAQAAAENTPAVAGAASLVAGRPSGSSADEAPAPDGAEAPTFAGRSPVVLVAAGVVCVLFALLAMFPLFLVDRSNGNL